MSEIEVTGFLSTFVASLIIGVFVKVASGPSKTTGLAKFQSDFTSLAVSFFLGSYVRLAVSIFS